MKNGDDDDDDYSYYYYKMLKKSMFEGKADLINFNIHKNRFK